MSAKKSLASKTDDILKNSVSLWNYLKNNAGYDSVFYDKDLLEGNEFENGIYTHLNIKKLNKKFEQDLEHYSISVELLLIAFFKTLQPFAQMMSDLCAFFERHSIKETNESLSISFDFDEAKNAGLSFNLENFRQTLEKLTKVKQLVTYYQLNTNQLWPLVDLFSEDFRVTTKNKAARSWIDKYKIDKNQDQANAIFSIPNFELPSTTSTFLDQQLNKIFAIWQSFINTCRNINPNRKVFQEEMRKYIAIKDEDMANEKTEPWAARDLYIAESDYWPATFLESLFYRLEEMEKLGEAERRKEEHDLAIEIEKFLDRVTVGGREEEQLLKELIDFLKIPIWKKRYELYAAWILTLIDDIFEDFPHEIHHNNGKLVFSFSATHLATIETTEGSIQLWSEVRSNVLDTTLKKLEGKSRTNNIQPDYGIFKGNKCDPNDCLVAIEVKQYRKHSNSNFSAALNDYTRGLPNADVFLVNYGSVSSDMTVSKPDQSHFFGQVKPISLEIESFKSSVRNFLPKSPLPYKLTLDDQFMLFNSLIEYFYIDISGSLDRKDYREYIEKLLMGIIKKGIVKRMIAVDDKVRQEWLNPDAISVKELLALSFDGSTDFTGLLSQKGNVLVITDEDGLSSMESTCIKAHVIKYVNENDQEINTLKGS